MKIIHITTIDEGGAYKAVERLNEMFVRRGHDSEILVRTKTGDNPYVIPAFDTKGEELISKCRNVLNLVCKRGDVKRDITGTDVSKNEHVLKADIIIVHWVSTFLSPREIYRLSNLQGKKVIFVMHDMWLFTGGCHVDRRCGGYVKECVDCPLVCTSNQTNTADKATKNKTAHRSFVRKARYIKESNLIITGPSRWIVEEANKSPILSGKKAIYVPNVLDTEIFFPKEDAAYLRTKYGLSLDKKVILFAAADTGVGNENKGFKYLLEAIKQIKHKDVQLAIIGKSDSAVEQLKEFDCKEFGFIRDENILADIYNAADVFVNPSLQESFGYTVCEAMACGTPAVAFAVGGMLDQIDHRINGYLAEYKDACDLARGIDYILDNRSELSLSARESACRFSYVNAYDKILSIVMEKESK